MNLSTTFSPESNHFHVLRHFAALIVIVDHAFIINGQEHLLARLGSKASLGAIGVAVFFVLSGALVTASCLKCKSGFDYAVRRVRRIYPGYLTCLLFSAFLIYPINQYPISTHDTDAWFAQLGPLAYVLKNASTLQFQDRINDLFRTHPLAFSVNGSLWSIAWEVGCYLMVFCLGVTGILRKRPSAVLVLLLVAILNVFLSPAGSVFGKYYLADRITNLPILFLSGAAFYLYRTHIERDFRLGLLSLAAFIGCLFVDWRISILFLPYAIFALAHSETPVRTDLPDLSYGMYIYSFPIQQSIRHFLGDRLSVPVQLAIALVLVLPIAYASWKFVESPWLKRKVATKTPSIA